MVCRRSSERPSLDSGQNRNRHEAMSVRGSFSQKAILGVAALPASGIGIGMLGRRNRPTTWLDGG
jgi:hypothetical protein